MWACIGDRDMQCLLPVIDDIPEACAIYMVRKTLPSFAPPLSPLNSSLTALPRASSYLPLPLSNYLVLVLFTSALDIS